MASLFDIGNSSDSEEDCDYEPPADELSSEDEEPLPCSDDEKDVTKKSRNRNRNSKNLFKAVSKTTEETKLLSESVDVKKKAIDVYKSFLDEVAADMKDAKNESMSSGISCSESNNSSPIVQNINKNSFISSSPNTPEKVVELDKETAHVNRSFFSLSSNSPCNSNSSMEKSVPSSAADTSAAVKRKGLDSVLGNILNKKQKMTTLTKSLLDWKNFKEEEGIEEDLASYNRGKGGYIERKRFLERSDVRSFEIEREMRQTKRQTKKDV